MTLTPNAKIVLKYITRNDARVFSDGRVVFGLNDYDNILEIPRKQIIFAFDELEDAKLIKVTYKGYKDDYPVAMIEVLAAGHNFDFYKKEEKKTDKRTTKENIRGNIISAIFGGVLLQCILKLIELLFA